MVQPSMNVPVGERPDMPEGYLGAAPLPWRWAEEQLSEAHNYWVTTIGPSGRPHVRPVWGVWLDNAVQFSTGARHASNIGRDPRVTVNLEDADDCVIVEGTARAPSTTRTSGARSSRRPGVDALPGHGDEMALRYVIVAPARTPTG
jgi:hypothetical protein